LYTAALELGSQTSSNLHKTLAVERCACPPGYEGLSCQSCSFGYTRVNATLYNGECRLCDCNGHAATCDPYTFRCDTCLHNTEGERCQRCKAGFYGDPANGSPDDCKPCKCPLEEASNNFSPTCKTSSANFDKFSVAPRQYVCTACPLGYSGFRCERCDDGFFGNPLKLGDFCKACDCSGNGDKFAPNWCDHRSGECLLCLGNTGGWKCDQCLPGFWGDPFSGQCQGKGTSNTHKPSSIRFHSLRLQSQWCLGLGVRLHYWPMQMQRAVYWSRLWPMSGLLWPPKGGLPSLQL